MTRIRRHRRMLLLLLLLCVVGFLATTENTTIQPLRNIALYNAAHWWQRNVGLALPSTATLRGCVESTDGAALPGARLLLSERNGMLHQATTGADGCYQLAGVPAGRYVPVASAPGYADTFARPRGMPLLLTGGPRQLDVQLAPASPPTVQPGTAVQISAPVALRWPLPQPSTATRRQITFTSDGQPNTLTYLYTPAGSPPPLPTLLAVYPGPADLWEGVSIPLAAAGYAVIAIGPDYALDLEHDVAQVQQLVGFARAGALPGADGQRIVLLGGSYSSLHVQRLLARDQDFRGVMLLGAASDMFTLRQRFEQGSFLPPFGLDQALVALGTPNSAPERYWRYSSHFHARATWPPILLMHSRSDEVVPFAQSELLAADLTRLGVPHEAHFFDGMSHYLLADRPSAELSTLYALTTDFLARVTREGQRSVKREA